MKRWFKEGMVYGVSATLSKFRGVFLAPIFTRMLGPEKYGLLDISVTLSAICILLAEMQMVSGFGRSYFESKERGDRDVLAGTVMTFYLFSVSCVAFSVWMLRNKLSLWLPGFRAELLIPLLVALFPHMLNEFCLLLLRYEHRAKAFLVLSQLHIWFAGVLAAIAVLVFKAEVMGILVAFAISAVLCSFVSLYLIIKATGLRLGFRHLKELLAYSVPIVPAVIGGWLQGYASRFFIVGMLSMTMLGIYSVAVKVAALMLLFATSFRRVWGPYAMEQYTVAGSEKKFAMALNLYLFLTFVGLALIGSSGPVLVPLIAGSEFYAAIPFVTVLASAYVWEGVFSILGAGNAWERKTYHNTLGCLVGGGVNMLLLWKGLERFGLVLVPFAFLIGMILRALITMWTAQRNHHIPYDSRSVVLALITSLVYGVACYAMNQWPAAGMFGAPALSLLLCGVAVVIMWRVIMTPDEQQRVKALLQVVDIRRYIRE